MPGVKDTNKGLRQTPNTENLCQVEDSLSKEQHSHWDMREAKDLAKQRPGWRSSWQVNRPCNGQKLGWWGSWDQSSKKGAWWTDWGCRGRTQQPETGPRQAWRALWAKVIHSHFYPKSNRNPWAVLKQASDTIWFTCYRNVCTMWKMNKRVGV